MQFFLNELTLQEQYLNGRDFEDAIVCFLSTAKKIQEIDYPKELLSDKKNLASFKPIAGKYFQERLKEVDVGLRKRFKGFIYDISDDWRKNQRHSVTDIFAIGTDNVTDTSAAEIAERKYADCISPSALLNFKGSTLQGRQSIIITKNGATTINIDCVESLKALIDWISHYQTEIAEPTNPYDFSSASPPGDNQTILRQSGRFARTNKVDQGRTVYREKRTGYYWCVDNFHRGSGSHLEVFDQRGEHIGESDLDGNVDINKKDTTKKINL